MYGNLDRGIIQARLANNSAQEGNLLTVAFNQVDMLQRPIRIQNCQNEPGKARAATEINQLRMTSPEVLWVAI